MYIPLREGLLNILTLTMMGIGSEISTLLMGVSPPRQGMLRRIRLLGNLSIVASRLIMWRIVDTLRVMQDSLLIMENIEIMEGFVRMNALLMPNQMDSSKMQTGTSSTIAKRCDQLNDSRSFEIFLVLAFSAPASTIISRRNMEKFASIMPFPRKRK